MGITTRLVPPGAGFWPQAARLVIDAARASGAAGSVPDLSGIRVMVPTFVHLGLLRRALAAELGLSFIAPQATTLSAWLQQQFPDIELPTPASDSERLMALYARLREQGWLKKLFAARRNTDLLPLAKTLLILSDELTAALLPVALALPGEMEARWRSALAQLSPQAITLLSDEAQLVWGIWHGQRDPRDPGVVRHAALCKAAAAASEPLLWIAPAEPDQIERDFLRRYSQRQLVYVIRLDWAADFLPASLAQSWPEISAEGAVPEALGAIEPPACLTLYQATGLEDEAQCAAQTILDWLMAGKNQIAIVPQDRVVARRLRALLERAQVVVADETGWKLSTTRAAAVLASWMELVSSGAQTAALLDFLKSPFLFADSQAEEQQRMAIERVLVDANIIGGWSAVAAAVAEMPVSKSLIDAMAREAARFVGRKSIVDWVETTQGAFDALGMRASLAEDVAGHQVLEMLDVLAAECTGLPDHFSMAEWRALVNLQLEQTVFIAARLDQRVMMVPLNGTPLRQFDAVMVVGGDADHLPSQPTEALFFANAVRRELGLATRESRQQQQLRDFAALLLSCPTVVLSWQAQREGEHNPVSVWIQRMQLNLARAKADTLALHKVRLPLQTLREKLPLPPQPSAASLLPGRLSASGYNALVACPYQFFATRMLGLSVLEGLNALPEKRDYGDWLHQILFRYHQALHETPTQVADRAALLIKISAAVFDPIIEKNPAALGFQSRWNKTMPAYLEWANAHESEGWQFAFGEQGLQKELTWDGGAITLQGRLDRVDRNAEGDLLVLDYKTSEKPRLKKKLARHEDHQLPFYGLLADPAPVGGWYVAIDGTKAGTAEAAPFDAWRSALSAQIGAGMQAIASGASLPATGVNKTCQWCDVRGLCRKGAW